MTSETLREVVAIAIAFVASSAALVTGIGILAKSRWIGRPFRWLWRRNVADPVTGWARHNMQEVVDDRVRYLMTHNNGGSSLKDLGDGMKILRADVDSLRSDVGTLLEHDAERDTEGKRYGPNEGGTE